MKIIGVDKGSPEGDCTALVVIEGSKLVAEYVRFQERVKKAILEAVSLPPESLAPEPPSSYVHAQAHAQAWEARWRGKGYKLP